MVITKEQLMEMYKCRLRKELYEVFMLVVISELVGGDKFRCYSCPKGVARQLKFRRQRARRDFVEFAYKYGIPINEESLYV